jgi:CMP-N,N'-diacetyllegionaminic acid synthase
VWPPRPPVESRGMGAVAIIPARARSVGIPNKNLRHVGGLPLVVRTIRVATQVLSIDRIIVSTDSEQIADVARRSGAEVPFLRPASLAGDETATVAVIEDAVSRLEVMGAVVETVVTMQPTSPFCRPQTVATAIAMLEDVSVDSVATVAELGVPASVIGAIDGGRLVRCLPLSDDPRRQASPPAVRLTGAVYVSRRQLIGSGVLLGVGPAYVMTDGPEALDIDTLADLGMARRMVRKLPVSQG